MISVVLKDTISNSSVNGKGPSIKDVTTLEGEGLSDRRRLRT